MASKEIQILGGKRLFNGCYSGFIGGGGGDLFKGTASVISSDPPCKDGND